ncbi:hypothetical protein [Methanocrinis sp.]|uniref:hypothetical protein n=1 Tax=Methanocrinis sp. TaxID=3101522 RepID=UPI003D0E850C
MKSSKGTQTEKKFLDGSEIVAGPDFRNLAPDHQERLDLLQVEKMVALRQENVCTNERCPHQPSTPLRKIPP